MWLLRRTRDKYSYQLGVVVIFITSNEIERKSLEVSDSLSECSHEFDSVYQDSINPKLIDI